MTEEIQRVAVIGSGQMGMQQQYEETGDPALKPNDSVVEKVQAGNLGRKTGKGWYEYTPEGARPIKVAPQTAQGGKA